MRRVICLAVICVIVFVCISVYLVCRGGTPSAKISHNKQTSTTPARGRAEERQTSLLPGTKFCARTARRRHSCRPLEKDALPRCCQSTRKKEQGTNTRTTKNYIEALDETQGRPPTETHRADMIPIFSLSIRTDKCHANGPPRTNRKRNQYKAPADYRIVSKTSAVRT